MPLESRKFLSATSSYLDWNTPGTVLYVYIGSLAGSLASLGTEGRTRTPEWAFMQLVWFDGGVVTLYVTRIAQQALEKKSFIRKNHPCRSH